ncbi:MAG TPA: STAS domain-containing protein [Gaiella sp.]|jgi:anti-anti-sigma factor|nr:STAS domain-containing protein [Gaiella sp.]
MEHVDFEIVVEATEAGRRIAVRGDLDLATVGELVSALDSPLQAREAVVLVLEECTFLDSSALKAIADASRRADAAGSTFAVSRPSVQAARVLELSGLNEIVTIERSDYP